MGRKKGKPKSESLVSCKSFMGVIVQGRGITIIKNRGLNSKEKKKKSGNCRTKRRKKNFVEEEVVETNKKQQFKEVREWGRKLQKTNEGVGLVIRKGKKICTREKKR